VGLADRGAICRNADPGAGVGPYVPAKAVDREALQPQVARGQGDVQRVDAQLPAADRTFHPLGLHAGCLRKRPGQAGPGLPDPGERGAQCHDHHQQRKQRHAENAAPCRLPPRAAPTA